MRTFAPTYDTEASHQGLLRPTFVGLHRSTPILDYLGIITSLLIPAILPV